MASLGELTAGIAHEIQNPLNFVNNFSEVSNELITDALDALDVGPGFSEQSAREILKDVQDNLIKIAHHGKRADAIVKGMLQHSQSSSGIKTPTNINLLADEYLRLAYNGLRVKDKAFTARLETEFDNTLGNISIIPQDLGRVMLNLINNGFYAVKEKKKLSGNDYVPTVWVKTKRTPEGVEIGVSDNGNGIPETAKEKIFQPFFTTKPTGQGTGLGLSLSYDIIVKGHGGTLKVKSDEGQGSDFTVFIPVN
jgi:signal transduction histidine kinase